MERPIISSSSTHLISPQKQKNQNPAGGRSPFPALWLLHFRSVNPQAQAGERSSGPQHTVLNRAVHFKPEAQPS